MAKDKKKRGWKWFSVILALIAASAFGLWYFKFRGDDVPEYQTAEVTRGDLTQVVTATGQLNPVTNVQVGCQISGIVQKLYADFNTHVTNGQVVAQLDPATYEANLHQAQGDLANSKASLELAQVNAKRSKELFDTKLIPESDYDQAIASLHQAEATVQVKQAAAESDQVNLDRCTILSPVDGIVISRNVDVGQTVAASLNAPTLFVIANDLTKMQIDADVAEADVGGVEVGQKVDFTVDAFPNRTFHGLVTQIRNSPIISQGVVSYDTVIEVDNSDLKLKPGMTANVSIILAHRDDVLKVSNAALRYHPMTPEGRPTGGGSHRGQRFQGARPGRQQGKVEKPERERSDHGRTVYVLAKAATEPQPRNVTLGITDGIYTEVVSGLHEGEDAVTGVLLAANEGATPSPLTGFRRRR
ncbi:MAG TPA: efflux RND transporter periplasmic adaptor subunit [Verrucomicrobiae bacterium]|nr:efflux RND transporter periplasmic adaptor subunit [Verrucomicrobiae bacterium]